MIRLSAIRLSAFAIASLLAFPALAGEGFGMFKKTANLVRIHPPQVRLTGTRLALRVSSQGSHYTNAVDHMHSALESQLLGNDARLSTDSKNPEVTIDVKILRDDFREEWKNKKAQHQVQTGTDSKNRPTYRWETVDVRVKNVKHSFSAAYKVIDVKAGRSLAGDTMAINFDKDFEEGEDAPDQATLEDAAVSKAVGDLAQKLTTTKEQMPVLLPRGSMEGALPFGEAGMWSKYLEMLEKAPKLANPVDDSYRQYAMGLAYEALGYGADDLETTLKYLEQASMLYNNAAEANPKEKYFILTQQPNALFSKIMSVAPKIPGVSAPSEGPTVLAPLARVQAALVQYQKLKDIAGGGGGGVTRTASGAKGLDAPVEGTVTNDSVVEMLRAGLAEEIILTSIDSAPATAFDTSPKGLIQLSEAKASPALLKHIQQVGTRRKPALRPKSKKTS